MHTGIVEGLVVDPLGRHEQALGAGVLQDVSPVLGALGRGIGVIEAEGGWLVVMQEGGKEGRITQG